MPFQFKLNLDSELTRLFVDYELIIPSCVLSELKGLQYDEKFGGVALKLAKTKPQPEWYVNFEYKLLLELANSAAPETIFNPTDDLLLRIAQELSGIVVTNDKILLARLKEHKIRTISLRSKKYLKPNFKL